MIKMKPIYYSKYLESADAYFQHFMEDLNWLQVTEARKEYFIKFLHKETLGLQPREELLYNSRSSDIYPSVKQVRTAKIKTTIPVEDILPTEKSQKKVTEERNSIC